MDYVGAHLCTQSIGCVQGLTWGTGRVGVGLCIEGHYCRAPREDASPAQDENCGRVRCTGCPTICKLVMSTGLFIECKGWRRAYAEGHVLDP